MRRSSGPASPWCPGAGVRAARVPFVTLVSLVLLGGVIGLLLFNTSMQQAAFAATALESQAGSLSAREQTLRMELDVLRDPQRVAERAQAMGMVPAVSSPFIRLSDGKVLGAPTASTPARQPCRIRPKAPAQAREPRPAAARRGRRRPSRARPRPRRRRARR